VVSLLTAPPSRETIAKYFPQQRSETLGQGAKAEPAIQQYASRGR
jgi:hypothetical protein